jgi:type III secretion protein T
MTYPFESVQTLLLTVCLLMARLLVAFSLFPLFMGNAMPVTVRLSFVVTLSLCLVPMLGPNAKLLQLQWAELLPYLLKEVGLGLVLGLSTSFIFWAIHAAGAVIEYQAGLNMSNTIDPLLGREDSLIGGFLLQLFSIVFLMAGGLLALIGMLFESYRIWPVQEMVPILGNIKLTALLLTGVTSMIELVIKIAAPFVILMLVAELALGLLSLCQ